MKPLKSIPDTAPECEITEFIETRVDIRGSEKVEAKTSRFHGFFFAMLSAVFMGLSSVFIKKAEYFNASEVIAVRYIIQFLMMFVMIIFRRTSFTGPNEARNPLLIRAIFGMLGLIMVHYSVKLITPSDTTAIMRFSLILVAIMARISFKEKISIATLVSILLSIVGVLLIAQPSFLFPKQSINASNYSASNSNETFQITDVNEISQIQILAGITCGK